MAKLFGSSGLRDPANVDLTTLIACKVALAIARVRASSAELLMRLTVEGESLTVTNDITQKATELIKKRVEAEVE
jgi:phosphomannomutase